MRPVEMKRAATDDFIAFFQDHKVADVLADLRQAARQQCAVPGISCDQIIDSLRIRQDSFTRAHALPRVGTRSDALHLRSHAALVPEPYPPGHHEEPAPR